MGEALATATPSRPKRHRPSTAPACVQPPSTAAATTPREREGSKEAAEGGTPMAVCTAAAAARLTWCGRRGVREGANAHATPRARNPPRGLGSDAVHNPTPHTTRPATMRPKPNGCVEPRGLPAPYGHGRRSPPMPRPHRPKRNNVACLNALAARNAMAGPEHTACCDLMAHHKHRPRTPLLPTAAGLPEVSIPLHTIARGPREPRMWQLRASTSVLSRHAGA